jgi:hypothetical protein
LHCSIVRSVESHALNEHRGCITVTEIPEKPEDEGGKRNHLIDEIEAAANKIIQDDVKIREFMKERKSAEEEYKV